jgi:nucleoside-diphosphate-sugar epimerase
MKRILIVGCGDIAMRVAPLLRRRYRLLGLARRAEHFPELRAAGISPLHADLDDRTSLARIAGLADILLHFAPPPSTSHPKEDGKRRPDIDTRTRNLLAALSHGRKSPKHLVYISTSGVYGDCGGAEVSETRPPNPQTIRARLRANAERQIRDWAGRNQVSATILRVPGIYANDRLPLERLRAGTPAIVREEDSYTNHIHADDLAHIVLAALRHARPNRVYHASDNSQIKMGDYFDAVADAHSLPRPPRLPRTEVECNVPPALWSFMNESRRLSNERMKRELKIKLRYPTVADALASGSL